jgi:hypothetical protein
MSPARITVRVEGVQALLRDLRDDPVHAKPWIKALHEAAKLAEGALRKHAPGTKSKGDIKMAFGKGPVPKWGRARMPNRIRGKSRDGRPFRVLGALHGSKRIKFHYRSGPLSGKLTFDWFEIARRSVRDPIVRLVTRAEREIESRWGRRG